VAKGRRKGGEREKKDRIGYSGDHSPSFKGGSQEQRRGARHQSQSWTASSNKIKGRDLGGKRRKKEVKRPLRKFRVYKTRKKRGKQERGGGGGEEGGRKKRS